MPQGLFEIEISRLPPAPSSGPFVRVSITRHDVTGTKSSGVAACAIPGKKVARLSVKAAKYLGRMNSPR
jgi:hypothetical protein